MKKLKTMCLLLALTSTMAISANAADYEFLTAADTGYYQSTNYEDLYDAPYVYGGKNRIDYAVPELRYGLSQEFLETSLMNPYLSSTTQYTLHPGA